MSIRFNVFIFFRFALLAFFAFFSLNSFAGYTYPTSVNACYSTQAAACSANNGTLHSDGNMCNIQGSWLGAGTCNLACPAGQIRSTTSALCVAAPTCTVQGQTNNPSTGACECPSGQQPDTGTLSDIVAGTYPKQCKTPAATCSRRSGQSFFSYTPVSSSDGCTVSCSIDGSMEMSGQTYPTYNCKYTGATSGSPDGDPTKAETQQVVPGVPNLPTPPFMQDPNPTTGACPTPGSTYGYVNGQPKCIPPTQSNGSPNVPTTATEAQTQTQITNTKTVTNSDGSTSTITTVTTVTNTSVNGGSGSGNGNGSGEGAGECDPTDDNYFQCTGLLQAAPSDKGQSFIDGQTNVITQKLNDYESAVHSDIDSVANTDVGSPSSIGSQLVSMLPHATSCTPLVFSYPGHNISLPCDKFENFKLLFAYFLYIATAIYIYHIASRPIEGA